MKKIILIISMLILLFGCNNKSQDHKPTIHQYIYGDISLNFEVSENDYQTIERMNFHILDNTLSMDRELSHDEAYELLETNRQQYIDFVSSIEGARLTIGYDDPVYQYFISVIITPAVIESANGELGYSVKFYIDFEDEKAQSDCCGFDEIMTFFKLTDSLDDRHLTLDKVIENDNFTYHEIIGNENGMYLQRFKSDE